MKNKETKFLLHCLMFNVFVISIKAMRNVSQEMTILSTVRTSCINGCQTPRIVVSDCACDNDCLFYGDCCRDYLYYCNGDGDNRNKTKNLAFLQLLSISADKTKPRWNCVKYQELESESSTEGMLVVKSCPPSWNIDDVRIKCQETNRQIVNEGLVSDSRGYVYANQFCAICNTDIKITLNETIEINSTLCANSSNSKNCTEEFLVEDISRDAMVVRPCSLQLIDTCLSHTSEYLQFACTAFTEQIPDGFRVFKNGRCKLCNELIVTVFEPDEPVIVGIYTSIFGGTSYNFELIPTEYVEKRRCNTSEYYDAATEVCQRCENGTVVSESDYLYLTTLNDDGLDISLLNRMPANIMNLSDNTAIYLGGSGRQENLENDDPVIKDREDSVCITSCIEAENQGSEINSDEYKDWITLTTNNSTLKCLVLKNVLVNVTVEDHSLFSYDKSMTAVNILVCVISLVALLISILTLCCFPSLLNLPGICRLCLMISLFLTTPKELCVGTAAVMHYFWLATFFWTNILAFDLARVFGIKSARTSSAKKQRLLYLYMTYGWGFPLIIVALCLVLHFTNISNLTYGGVSFCWFTNRKSLFVAFGIPVSCCIVLNFILYIVTVVGIWKVRRVTEFAVREEERGKKRKDELKLYIKLSILMGAAWILVFVTVYTDETILWYIFIILNGLQGFFIFIAFTCTRQTFNKWKGFYESSVDSQSGSRSTKTTSV